MRQRFFFMMLGIGTMVVLLLAASGCKAKRKAKTLSSDISVFRAEEPAFVLLEKATVLIQRNFTAVVPVGDALSTDLLTLSSNGKPQQFNIFLQTVVRLFIEFCSLPASGENELRPPFCKRQNELMPLFAESTTPIKSLTNNQNSNLEALQPASVLSFQVPAEKSQQYRLLSLLSLIATDIMQEADFEQVSGFRLANQLKNDERVFPLMKDDVLLLLARLENDQAAFQLKSGPSLSALQTAKQALFKDFYRLYQFANIPGTDVRGKKIYNPDMLRDWGHSFFTYEGEQEKIRQMFYGYLLPADQGTYVLSSLDALAALCPQIKELSLALKIGTDPITSFFGQTPETVKLSKLCGEENVPMLTLMYAHEIVNMADFSLFVAGKIEREDGKYEYYVVLGSETAINTESGNLNAVALTDATNDPENWSLPIIQYYMSADSPDDLDALGRHKEKGLKFGQLFISNYKALPLTATAHINITLGKPLDLIGNQQTQLSQVQGPIFDHNSGKIAAFSFYLQQLANDQEVNFIPVHAINRQLQDFSLSLEGAQKKIVETFMQSAAKNMVLMASPCLAVGPVCATVKGESETFADRCMMAKNKEAVFAYAGACAQVETDLGCIDQPGSHCDQNSDNKNQHTDRGPLPSGEGNDKSDANDPENVNNNQNAQKAKSPEESCTKGDGEVCGEKDSGLVTYANQCRLTAAGARLKHAGPCPSLCPANLDYVCGQKGGKKQTYLNSCKMKEDKATLSHQGSCDIVGFRSVPSQTSEVVPVTTRQRLSPREVPVFEPQKRSSGCPFAIQKGGSLHLQRQNTPGIIEWLLLLNLPFLFIWSVMWRRRPS